MSNERCYDPPYLNPSDRPLLRERYPAPCAQIDPAWLRRMIEELDAVDDVLIAIDAEGQITAQGFEGEEAVEMRQSLESIGAIRRHLARLLAQRRAA